MDEEEEDGASEQSVLKVSNIRGFLATLQAIKPSNPKQVCTIILSSEGMWVKWEDDSKSLQSSLFLGRQLFAEFECPWVRKQFGLQFTVLLDTISVFQSSLSQSDLVFKFPGTNEQLICEMMEESGESTAFCTYCQIDTREPSPSRDLSDYWQEPDSFFLISGSLLKEAVEDLEWVFAGMAEKGVMTLAIQRAPPCITVSANSTGGSLEVKLPADDLQGFQCAELHVSYKYKYKHIKATVANLPQAKDATAQTSTKVTIDSQGLIKVTHMMNLQGGPRALGGTFQGLAAFAETQRASNTNAGVVRFISAPDEVFGEE